jgi:hypothetical protein
MSSILKEIYSGRFQPVRMSTLVGSTLAYKDWTRVEVTNSGNFFWVITILQNLQSYKVL